MDKPIVESKPAAGEKKRPYMFLWVGLFVLMLALGGAGFMAYQRLVDLATHNGIAHADSNAEEQSVRVPVNGIMELEPFLVNLADLDDIRFLKATFKLGMTEKVKEATAAKNSVEVAAIRDSIISLLCSKTSDQIMTSEGKDELRKAIRLRVNGLVSGNKVGEVYIVEFVVQL